KIIGWHKRIHTNIFHFAFAGAAAEIGPDAGPTMIIRETDRHAVQLIFQTRQAVIARDVAFLVVWKLAIHAAKAHDTAHLKRLGGIQQRSSITFDVHVGFIPQKNDHAGLAVASVVKLVALGFQRLRIPFVEFYNRAYQVMGAGYLKQIEAVWSNPANLMRLRLLDKILRQS